MPTVQFSPDHRRLGACSPSGNQPAPAVGRPNTHAKSHWLPNGRSRAEVDRRTEQVQIHPTWTTTNPKPPASCVGHPRPSGSTRTPPLATYQAVTTTGSRPSRPCPARSWRTKLSGRWSGVGVRQRITVLRRCCGATLKQRASLMLSKAPMARCARTFTPYATRS
jgi:hypothetical protein